MSLYIAFFDRSDI